MKIGKINSSQDGIVFSIHGISQCLSAGHGNAPKILIDETVSDIIRETNRSHNTRGGGRSSMTKKHNWDVVVEQEIFSGTLRPGDSAEGFRPAKDNCVPTLTTKNDENTSGTPVIVISANTQKGFEEVEPGDNINFSVPNSKTRRGRVGKGKAQTLDTQCNQGVFVGKIRRLTEIECERLQGLPQNWTKIGIYDERPTRKDLLFREKNAHLWAYQSKILCQDVCIREISSTQRYKMIGNGVTRDVVEMIGKKILATLLKDG